MITTHPPMLDEILGLINDSPDPVSSLTKKYTEQPFLKFYMELATSDRWISIDINAVSVKDYQYHRSLAGSLLLNRHTVSVIDYVLMGESDNSELKISQYRGFGEMLYSGEAKILKAILMKNLETLYPRLTHEVISQSLNS